MSFKKSNQAHPRFILKLRMRTLIVVTVTLAAMMALLVTFSQTIVKGGFESVEKRDALLNVSRVRDAFDMQIENVDVKIIDWSMWDDAYKYMKDGNPEFEKSSLAIGALLGMKFELFVWRFPDGKIRWARQFDLENEKEYPLSPDVVDFFNRNTSLFEFKNEKDRKGGIIDIPTIGPTFFAVQPIVTSDGKGPIVGSLIAGRAINAQMLDKIKKLTHLEIEMRTTLQAANDKDFLSFLPQLKNISDAVVVPVNEQFIAGYGLFKDFFDKPVAYIRMTTPRDIHAQGERTVFSFFAALGVAGLGFGIVIIIMLEKNVISRVTELAQALLNIRGSSNLSLRVPVSGHDEISALSTETNEMLASIELGQKAIAARNDDMKLILDNAEQGFLNVGLDGVMIGERSAVVDRWLGRPGKSAKIWNYLHKNIEKNADSFRLGWDQLVEDFLPFEVIADQMPRRIVVGADTYEVNMRPVMREGHLSSILVVVSDITVAVEAEIKDMEQREAMKVVQLLLADRNAVLEFFEETKKGVNTVVASSETLSHALLMRIIHTLKGNAAQQGIHSFANACHELESKLTEGDRLSREDINAFSATWTSIEKRFSLLLQEKNSGKIEVAKGDLDAALMMASNRQPYEVISQTLLSWQLEPIGQRFSRLARIAESLGERLGKTGIKTNIDDGGVRIESEAMKEFWSSMVHVMRNAVDHGLESAEERKRQGKAEGGTISFRAKTDHIAITIEVSDDGRGVNWDAIRARAEKKNFKCKSQEDLVAALFADGISTKDEVTEVSGRGFGMAAVRQLALSLCGEVFVISEQGKGTTIRFVIPNSSIKYIAIHQGKDFSEAA